MLIRFHVRNFLSFDEEIELSLIPGRARQHPRHIVATQARCDLNVLRAALIYGANASGKSNLIKALHFAQQFIIEGSKINAAIPRIPFKLCRANAARPSKFAFEFQQGTRCYAYGFEVDHQRVCEEWLYEIKKTTETLLFERVTTTTDKTSVDFGNIPVDDKKAAEFLEFVAMGTRPNQLFLTESMARGVGHFAEIYQWFANVLIVMYPHNRLMPLASMAVDDDFGARMAAYMQAFGTGITGAVLKPVDPATEFSPRMLQQLRDMPPNTTSVSVSTGESYSLNWHNGDLEIQKLMFQHRMADADTPVTFDITEESEGTRRLLDLLPAFASFAGTDRVMVIDELERSLHPHLSYKLLALFLANTTGQSQIIATTHEEHLLDLELLRRDEIWFVEKDRHGASHVYSLEEFTPRYDKDIERGYLVGRYGAIPVFGDLSLAQA